MKLLNVCLVGSAILFFYSCGVKYNIPPFIALDKPVQYQSKYNWAVYNGKTIDGLAIGDSFKNTKADVFFVYPTLFTNKNDKRWNAQISDSLINYDLHKWVIPFQASAWADAGRLFVPYYRQNHYRAYFEPYLSQGGLDAHKFAYNDIKAAFEYYLKNNNGRPIILAGHSQGAQHLKKILQDYFDGKPLQAQLVGAYLVGTRVKESEFKFLKPLTTSNSIGGYVSWNSYKWGKYPDYYEWYNESVTTNPINWNNTIISNINDHKGLLFYDKTIYSQSLKVEKKDGMIWVSLPKVPKRFLMSFVHDYHRFDISLFWEDIRQNSLERLDTFFSK